MTEREMLLKAVQEASFPVTELNLFLDTHPGECRALAALVAAIAERKRAVCAYEQKYGALTVDSTNCSMYDWVEVPFPWE